MPRRATIAAAALCALSACVAGGYGADAGVVEGGSNACSPVCANDEVCQAGDCVPLGQSADALQHCADELNRYRAQVGLTALTRSSVLEDYAAQGAAYDAQHGQAHAHFTATQGGGVAFAENEIPGWPLGADGEVNTIIDEGTAMMWGEGPGGPHYEIIVGPYSEVGCGVYLTEADNVWVVQDFR